MSDVPDPTAPAEAAEAELERLGGVLAELEAKAEAYRNEYLRAIAEAENVRKRAQRDIEAAHRFAVERFAADLVEVRDSLELGIAAANKAEGASHAEGMEATLRLLDRAFERAGIVVIEPSGKPFDPAWHEAMVAQPHAEAAPGTVLNVIQRGYQLNGRLLRPARVIVARAPDPA